MLDLDQKAEITVKNTSNLGLALGTTFLAPGASARVPLEWLALYGNTPGIVADFTGYADELRITDETGRPTFDYYAPLSAVDGYGRHALDVYKGLTEIGVAPVLRSAGFEDHDFLDPTFLAMTRDNKRRPPTKVSLTFSVPYDPLHHENPSVHHVSISQFETDHVPYRHIERLNKVDHLIVTSKFQPKVWRESGYTGRISVMTPGIDTAVFTEQSRQNVGLFRCLILGALSGRKNSAGAVRIFQKASEGDPRWRLTVKTRGHVDPYVRESAFRDSRIVLVNADLPPAMVLALYRDHECLIWPSKGEGVGLPPMEAMATGMEVVISDNTGMSDYVNKKHCWPIKSAGKEPADRDGTYSAEYVRDFGGVGNFVLPDESHAVDQLRAAYNAWLEGKGKGPKAAEYIRRNHTLAHQAESVLAVVQEYF